MLGLSPSVAGVVLCGNGGFGSAAGTLVGGGGVVFDGEEGTDYGVVVGRVALHCPGLGGRLGALVCVGWRKAGIRTM